MAMDEQHDAGWYDASFDDLVRDLMSQHPVPGLSIAVVKDGKIWTKGYGLARLPDIPADADTLYCAGSTTKAMLAACIGLVMHQQPTDSQSFRILTEKRFSTTIKSILKDHFVLQDEYATDNITIEDALSNRTGLPGAELLYGNWMGQAPRQITRALRYLGPLSKPFRTAWQYNNLMYSVVADVLETVLGCRWGTALHRLIWSPLGMNRTYADVDDVPQEQRSRLAWGYHCIKTGSSRSEVQYLRDPQLTFAGIGPAASVVSSVKDYAKYMIALLTAAKDDQSNINDKDHSLFPHDLFVELTTPRTFSTVCLGGQHTSSLPYSLGWFHFPSSAGVQHPIIAHAGGVTGFATQLYLLPNDGFGITTMANAPVSGHWASEAICLEVIARFLKLSPQTKKSFLQEMILPRPAAEENNPAPDVGMASVSFESREDPEWDDFVRKMNGTYFNPAYGTFELAEFKQGQNGETITYEGHISLDTRMKRDSLRKHSKSLSFVPLGHRTWHNRLILREQLQGQSEASQYGRLPIFLSLESFTVHGVKSSFPERWTDTTSQEIEKESSLGTWQSDSWSEYGAAFRRRDDVKAKGDSEAWSLGVRIGNAFARLNGRNTDGWETEMVWFTKGGQSLGHE